MVRGVLKTILPPFVNGREYRAAFAVDSGVYKRRDCEGDSAFGVVALFAVMLRLRRPLRVSEITVEIRHHLRFACWHEKCIRI